MLRSTGLSLFCLSIAPLLVAQTIEPEKLREDFRILRSALEEGQPGIYRYAPKEELDSVFDATAARLDRPMTALDFYRVLVPVIAALKCGHTSMGLSEELQKRAIPLFPAEVRVLDHKIYVFRDYSGTGGLAAAEIQSVNGVPAGRILQTMLTVEHGDGESTTAGPWRIGPVEPSLATFTCSPA